MIVGLYNTIKIYLRDVEFVNFCRIDYMHKIKKLKSHYCFSDSHSNTRLSPISFTSIERIRFYLFHYYGSAWIHLRIYFIKPRCDQFIQIPHPSIAFPNSLTYLYAGSDFNQSLNNLPVSLKSLTLGDTFNNPINRFPPELMHLTCGISFNQSLDDLPCSLVEICVSDYYNRHVNKFKRYQDD